MTIENNQSANSSLSNIKSLRSSTRKNAEELLTNVKQLKGTLNDLFRETEDIQKKLYADLAEQEQAAQAQAVSQSQNIISEQPPIEVKQTEKKEVSQPEQAVQPKEPTDKPKANKPVKEVVVNESPKKEVTAAVVDETPKPTVSPIVDNKKLTQPPPNANQRTYTDEKGNIKVRKFLTDVAPNKTASTPTNRIGTLNPSQLINSSRPQNTRPPYNQNTRPQGTRPPYNSRPNQSTNNPYNKDAATPSRTTATKSTTQRKSFGAVLPIFPAATNKQYGNKNKTPDKTDDKKVTKRSLLKKEFTDAIYDEDKLVTRKMRPKKETKQETVRRVIDKAVITTEEISLKALSEKTGVSVAQIIKQLFKEGIVKTINDFIDFDTAAIIMTSFNVELELKQELTYEEKMVFNESEDGDDSNKVKRPPIVTVMGHVDHGKTSLLDSIRNTTVTSGEAGGITQHIGAYTVKIKNELITFIDTPGHEAFTAMRQRGAKVTDIAILVVAADDGVMPQTIEALNHAKAADVPIIVAINKMDKPEANPDRIKQQLTEYNILPEEWGGDSIMVEISAKTGAGLDKLLESILLVAEVKELTANPDKMASGTVIEAQLDKGRGPVATILVRNGTLNIGDNIVAGTAIGKIRAMFDDKGKQIKSAPPSIPVSVLGFADVPNAGDFMYVVDEKLAKKVAQERVDQQKQDRIGNSLNVTQEDIFARISEGQLKTLNLIIKTDVQGSLEALKKSLLNVSNDEVKVYALHCGVGAVSETDVMLAKASSAVIIAFNVRPDSKAKQLAERENVDIRQYRVIYDAVDDITKAAKGMLAPKITETILGQISVREIYKISGVGIVAGSYVNSGKVTRNSKVRIYRDNVLLFDGQVLALKRFKDDVKEVAAGYECGITITNYSDLKVGDIFEAYIIEEVAG